MKLRRNHTQHAELVSSPLNDIMFFLLLFFLILSTVASPRVIKVLLPQADVKQEAIAQPVTVTVTTDKRYFIDDREIDFSDLENSLMQSINRSDATVVILPARSLSIQDLVDVLQIGVRNNLKMVLATTKK